MKGIVIKFFGQISLGVPTISAGLLHWDAPLLNADSVTEYRVHIDKSTDYNGAGALAAEPIGQVC